MERIEAIIGPVVTDRREPSSVRSPSMSTGITTSHGTNCRDMLLTAPTWSSIEPTVTNCRETQPSPDPKTGLTVEDCCVTTG